MARSLYARVAARGWPAFDYGGQTGQGALQAPPAETHGGQEGAGGNPQAVLFDPAVPGDAGTELIADGMWGLSAGARPDAEPGGPWTGNHAAPRPGLLLPPGEYLAESNEVHGISFGGPENRRDVPMTTDIPVEHWVANEGGDTNLQPLSGQVRINAGMDSVQGYGGGGPGPGGVNAVHQYGYWRDRTEYPADITPVMTQPAERPFLTEVPGQFIASDQTAPVPVTGFFGYDAPSASVSPQAPYEPPPLPPSAEIPAGDSAWAGSFYGG